MIVTRKAARAVVCTLILGGVFFGLTNAWAAPWAEVGDVQLRSDIETLAMAGVLKALVEVFFYLRVVVALYMRPAGEAETAARRLTGSEAMALAIPTLATAVMGVYPSPLLDLLARILG